MRSSYAFLFAATVYVLGLLTGHVWSDRSLQDATTDGAKSVAVVHERILNEHVGKDVTADELHAAAIAGMVAALDDKHTYILPPKRSAQRKEDLQGSYGGIGAAVTVNESEGVVITDIVDGSPADRADLQKGDVIEAVDGTEVRGLSGTDTRQLIRGEAGEEVTLTVRRGTEPPIHVTLERQETEVRSVFYQMLEGPGTGILHVFITQFGSRTGAEFREAVAEAKRSNARAILLDLRQNSGGFVTAAGDVACKWILDKPFVVERAKNKPGQDKNCSGVASLRGIPTAVLIDNQTASAAEIAAAALQDNGAVLVGQKSYGKGVGQISIKLFDGSELSLVTFEWLSPKGRSINGKGLDPDIETEVTARGIESAIDEQMAAAIKHLNGGR